MPKLFFSAWAGATTAGGVAIRPSNVSAGNKNITATEGSNVAINHQKDCQYQQNINISIYSADPSNVDWKGICYDLSQLNASTLSSASELMRVDNASSSASGDGGVLFHTAHEMFQPGSKVIVNDPDCLLLKEKEGELVVRLSDGWVVRFEGSPPAGYGGSWPCTVIKGEHLREWKETNSPPQPSLVTIFV